jgi:hypothetical protein
MHAQGAQPMAFIFLASVKITFLWSKTAESQVKKVIHGLSLHSSVFYPATLGNLSLAFSTSSYTNLRDALKGRNQSFSDVRVRVRGLF